MAVAIVIPIIIVAIIGITGYAIYRFVLYDFFCTKTVKNTLRRYNIKKTPSEIIKEYYEIKGESISAQRILDLEKQYRQNEPDQFLVMYDTIREKSKNKDEN